jgi:hypothetical protein
MMGGKASLLVSDHVRRLAIDRQNQILPVDFESNPVRAFPEWFFKEFPVLRS